MSFRYIYHAVHMTFSGGFEEAWQPGEPRESKMVFIGKGLDEQFLASSVPACGSLVVATLIASCHDQASTFNKGLLCCVSLLTVKQQVARCVVSLFHC